MRSGIRAAEQSAISGRQSAVQQLISAAGAEDPRGNKKLIRSCAEAIEELRVSRRLIEALETKNLALNERLESEKRTTELLTELNETRRSETEALRSAVAAKNDVITAKDEVINGQERLIEALKRKKTSPWKRVGDVLVGIAAGVLLR